MCSNLTWQSRCTVTRCHTRRSSVTLGSARIRGALQFEQRERRHAGGAGDALPGLLLDPATRLLVQVSRVAEGSGGQEVALDVLDAGLDDSVLLRIVRRAGGDSEVVAFGAFGIGTLYQRVAGTGLGDGAPGLVDDDSGRDSGESIEGAALVAQLGGHRLISDELDVMVARVAERHYKGPGAPRLAIRVHQSRSRAEVHLPGVARLETRAYRHLGGGAACPAGPPTCGPRPSSCRCSHASARAPREWPYRLRRRPTSARPPRGAARRWRWCWPLTEAGPARRRFLRRRVAHKSGPTLRAH